MTENSGFDLDALAEGGGKTVSPPDTEGPEAQIDMLKELLADARADRNAARLERDVLRVVNGALQEAANETPAEAVALRDRVKALEAGLAFYADEANWQRSEMEGAWHRVDRKPPVEADQGRRARSALAAPVEEQTPGHPTLGKAFRADEFAAPVEAEETKP